MHMKDSRKITFNTDMQDQWEAETLSECDLFSDVNNKSWKAYIANDVL